MDRRNADVCHIGSLFLYLFSVLGTIPFIFIHLPFLFVKVLGKHTSCAAIAGKRNFTAASLCFPEFSKIKFAHFNYNCYNNGVTNSVTPFLFCGGE